jgi:hypothetical protein
LLQPRSQQRPICVWLVEILLRFVVSAHQRIVDSTITKFIVATAVALRTKSL